MYFVYILVSRVDESLYTGQTQNLPARFISHNKGRVQSTRRKLPWRLGYFEVFERRAEAMWREREFKKKWNTERKKRLIAGFDRSKIEEILHTER
jgi:putative endonuclease